MARPETWRNLAPIVLTRVKQVKNIDFFYRDDIEVLFDVGERTALRIIAKVGKDTESARPRVGRTKLIRYLQRVAGELAKGMARVAEIYSAAQHRAEEDRALRERFQQELGETDLGFEWSRRRAEEQGCLADLPEGIKLEPGRVTIEFPSNAPGALGELLHSLGLALLNDHTRVMRQVVPDAFKDKDGALVSTDTLIIQSLEEERFKG
jgi:hypothetical protein